MSERVYQEEPYRRLLFLHPPKCTALSGLPFSRPHASAHCSARPSLSCLGDSCVVYMPCPAVPCTRSLKPLRLLGHRVPCGAWLASVSAWFGFVTRCLPVGNKPFGLVGFEHQQSEMHHKHSTWFERVRLCFASQSKIEEDLNEQRVCGRTLAQQEMAVGCWKGTD